jgi:5-methylthioadenosine/S-adenosylhomocysteine deaminase
MLECGSGGVSVRMRLMLAAAVFAAAVLAVGCAEADSAFDEDDNEETLGTDLTASGYRSGCKAPIRTGRYALLGDVVTPGGVLARGYVVVDAEQIAEVRPAWMGAPVGVLVRDVDGLIFPGLIDGHNHVEYNHIPLADLGKRYANRDQWPNAVKYQRLVKDPKNAVTAAGLKCQALKHGEARALVGGTTAIQGTPETACVRPLVRNLEQTNFCQDRVKQNVLGIDGFDRAYGGSPSVADQIKTEIAANKLDTFVVHAGEGIDEHERAEWPMLQDLGLATPALVMIHATAFGPAEMQQAASAGTSIVWSPLSNLLLYGKTTDIPAALDAGVRVSLGSDWSPSGSANVLGELKVADHVNRKLWNGRITDAQLVDMVTINAARTYHLDHRIGSIVPGKVADLVVVRKRAGVSAYRSLIDAEPADVLLVTISGDPLFGVPATMDALGKAGDYEVIDACGVPRAIDVTVTANDVPRGSESLASIETALVAVNPRLTPVIDCTNDEALKAYAGTALADAPSFPAIP